MLIAKETRELKELPAQEHEELVSMLSSYGMGAQTADTAAQEIAAEERLLEAHLRLEMGIDGEDLTNPWHAAFWSAVSFLAGAALPLLAVLVAPESAAGATVAIVTLIALAVTGYVSARLAGTNAARSVVRLVAGGALGLAITFGIGVAFGGVVG